MSTAAQGAAHRPGPQLPRSVRRWWSGLATRERVLVALMVAAIGAAATWVGWWEPLAARRTALQEVLPTLQAQAETLDALASARTARRKQRPMDTARLRAGLEAGGLTAHVRVIEQAQRRVLEIRDAPADALWNWLLPVLADPAVELQELTLERTGGEDMAAAQVTGKVVVREHSAEATR